MQITLDIKETVVKDFGLFQIQSFFEKQLQLLELQLLANKITDKLKQSNDTNWEFELENSREEAWLEYKSSFLNSIKK
jgi:hypothetical protein